jgi:predicted RNA-binding protein with RPS1 domain
MAAPRVSEALARSNRTPVYYQQIRHACRQLKTMPYPAGASADDKRAIMAQTLAWAMRLMRYMPVAKPVAGADSLRFTQSGATTAKAPPTAAGTTSKQPHSIRDLQPGMQLAGTVKRTAPFGAFVDVGVGRDGLVHVSKLRQGYVKEVESVIKQGESVTVWVEEVDAKQGRISLTMIAPASQPTPTAEKPKAIQPTTPGVDWQPGPSAAKPANRVPSTAEPAIAPLPTDNRPADETVIPPRLPTVVSKTVRPAAVTITTLEQVVEGLWIKGIVHTIESNRILVNIGLEREASLTFDRLDHIFGDVPDDIAEVAERLPIGTPVEVRVLRVSKKGVVQLTLKP